MNISKRNYKTKGYDMTTRVGPFLINRQSKQVSISANKKQLELRGKSYDLFEVLVRHSPQALSVHDLKELIWINEHVSDDTVRQRIKLLRSELTKHEGGSALIKNERGSGYYIREQDIHSVEEQKNHVANGIVTTLAREASNDTVKIKRGLLKSIMAFILMFIVALSLYQYLLNNRPVRLTVTIEEQPTLTERELALVSGFSLFLKETLIALPDLELFTNQATDIDAKVQVSMSYKNGAPAIAVRLLDLDNQKYLWSKTYATGTGRNHYHSLANTAAHVAMMLETRYNDELHESILNGETNSPSALVALILAEGYRQQGQVELAIEYANTAISHDENFGRAIQLRKSLTSIN